MACLMLIDLICMMIGCSMAVEFTDVLPVWITRTSMASGPRETKYYRTRLCGGSAYDGKVATVTINLPMNYWSDEKGSIVKVDVTNPSGEFIASNAREGARHVPEFSFVYSKSYSDIILMVTTGSAASFNYQLTVEFASNNQAESQLTYHDTKNSVEVFNLRDSPDSIIELGSIWRARIESVMTGTFVGFQLHYCFPKDLPYNFAISILGTDDTSAFASYVCLYGTKECGTDTKWVDLSGWKNNFVVAKITSSSDNGPVKVLVKGDGQAGQTNTFQLVGSISYKKYR